MTPTLRHSLGFALVALALVAAPAAQAAPAPAISIAVIDPGSDKQLYAVQNDDKIELTVGQTVLLQLFDPAWDTPTQRHRRNVGGKFDIVGDHSALKLNRPDHKNGTVFLTAHQLPKTNAPLRLAFNPDGTGRGGAVWVDIEGAPTAAGVVPAPSTTTPSNPPSVIAPDQAEKLVTVLYRGILLREPDPGASSWIEAVRRDGYARIGDVAQELAESRESRVDLYSREVCNQGRLVAMYKHLLGRGTEGIDTNTWQRQLDQLNRGDIVGVVSNLVESVDFQRAQGLAQRVAVN